MNKVFGTRIFDGIDVCVNNSVVKSNTIMNSSESAIHLDASCGSTGNGSTVTGNTIIDACTGILQDLGTSGGTIGPNTFSAAGATSGSSCTPTASVRPNAAVKAGVSHGVSHHSPVRP
jgi:hypothetical protein